MDLSPWEWRAFKRKARGCNNRNDDYESRSSTDHLDGGSGEDQDADNQLRTKRYHRHTPRQIQEMEDLFKECPHPNENQRQELSKRLCLEPRQVKFWFQNRRTQMKNQQERSENSLLRQENDRLRSEICTIREALRNSVCAYCGVPPVDVLSDTSSEEQQLRIGNASLKNELERVSDFVEKSLGRSIRALPPDSSLDRLWPFLALGTEFPEGIRSGDLMNIERTKVAELALIAMDELMRMARMQEDLWLPGCDDHDQREKEILNYEEYLNQFSRAPGVGPKPVGYNTDATRETVMVVINSLNLVETLMDVDRWTEMFPCVISRAVTVDVISSGVDGTLNGALQLMYAELQVLSPLVPTREVHFLRFCKQHSDRVWAVVDVSVDCLQENPSTTSFIKCRRQPSGCVIEDMPNGCSKVTWVEHSEYDEIGVHSLYQPVVKCGMAFGARCWVAALQRQSERHAIIMATKDMPTVDPSAIPTPSGRCSMLKLAQRMTVNYCSGVSASSVHAWTKLTDHTDDNVRITTRKSIDDPGEPPGIVLTAATSVWLPVSPKQLFEFLRDEKLRSKWDILSNGSPMQEITNIAKGQDPGNSVSLLKAANTNQSNMLILQESSTDASSSLIVYAPVAAPAMHAVMTGGDSTYVALLPSGFAILPNVPKTGSSGIHLDKDAYHQEHVGGSLLTVAFQILVNSLPTARLTMESVETVNNLISCTVQRIKSALDCKDA